MRYLGVAEDLNELAMLVADGGDFRQLIGSFIDYNKGLVKRGRKEEAATNFQTAPMLLAGKVDQGDVDDSFLAAMTEKLFLDWSLGTPPEWITAPSRFLDHPHFSIQTRYTNYLEKLKRISPEPFRKRNLFYTEKVLDRC